MLTPATKKEKFKKAYTPTKEQSQAVDHEGSDLLLSAGAGSGKTATLTDRIIKRITDEKHKIDISKMLVVTYTKDAANELKTRIAEKLGAQLQKKPNDPWLSSQYVSVTSVLRDCRISATTALTSFTPRGSRSRPRVRGEKI